MLFKYKMLADMSFKSSISEMLQAHYITVSKANPFMVGRGDGIPRVQ